MLTSSTGLTRRRNRRSYYAGRRWHPSFSSRSDSNPVAPPGPIEPPTDLPEHWHVEFSLPKPFNYIAKLLFRISLVVSLGHPDLEHVWYVSTHSEDIWLENKDRLSARITTLTVVAGLLLGSTATFITTPPPVTSLLDYDQRVPYYFLLVAFAVNLGGLIVGSAMIFILAKCTAEWSKNTLFGTRSRIFCTVLIIGYPFIAVVVSTALLALGLIIAAIWSDDPLMRAGSVVTLFIPISLFAAFIWTQTPSLRPRSMETLMLPTPNTTPASR